jgi:hypothetical protein
MGGVTAVARSAWHLRSTAERWNEEVRWNETPGRGSRGYGAGSPAV